MQTTFASTLSVTRAATSKGYRVLRARRRAEAPSED